jgi:hypothetical protein
MLQKAQSEVFIQRSRIKAVVDFKSQYLNLNIAYYTLFFTVLFLFFNFILINNRFAI